MYTKEEKVRILLENAKAYFNRGYNLQYDQYAMDRSVRVTPRHSRFAPPEMATEQHMLFLDCSTFTYAVYLNTFGYQLESNLTWQIPYMMKPLVYERTITHQETREERIQIRDEMLVTLQPGDVLNKRRYTGSGHVMLYMGNETIAHSTSQSPNSYQYKDLCEGIHQHGTIYINPTDKVFDVDGDPVSIFADNVDCVQIIRPVELVGDPTPAAISRAGKSKDLALSILSSHPCGKTAWTGDTVTYTLAVSNIGTETRTVDACVTDTENLQLLTENTCSFQVAPGQCIQKAFSFRLDKITGPVCPAPSIVANDIPVWAERVLTSRRTESETRNNVVKKVVDNHGDSLYNCIVSTYEKVGITLAETPFRQMFPCFRLYDSANGYALWRFPQNPETDLSLYSYFGGIHVITPELAADAGIRVRKVRYDALQPGDFVLVGEDPELQKIHCLFVTNEGIFSQFDGEAVTFIPNGEEADKLIDTLPGRSCFIAFRPEQQASDIPKKLY